MISVVIPTYKHARFVAGAVESALKQEAVEVEVIVVNDGSPDKTAEVLRPFVEAGRVHYVEQANTGQSAARNRGIGLARGEFVALLDDDDLWPAGKLEWQLRLLRANPAAVMAWGNAVRLDDGRPFHSPRPGAARQWAGSRVIHQCLIRSPGQTLIRRDAIRRVGGFDPDLWGADDFDLYIRLAEVGPFAYAPRTALRYRWHAANASHQTARMLENEQKVRRKHAAAVERRVAGPAVDGREARYEDLIWMAWYHFLDGRYGASRRHWLRAALAAPGRFVRRRAWGRARAAFVPDSIRPMWRAYKARRRPASEPAGEAIAPA